MLKLRPIHLTYTTVICKIQKIRVPPLFGNSVKMNEKIEKALRMPSTYKTELFVHVIVNGGLDEEVGQGEEF